MVRGVRPDARFRLYGREVVFDGRVVRVSRDRIRLPNGHEATYESIDLPSAVAVVAWKSRPTGLPDVVLVEQFRHAVRGAIHEVPAGLVEDGEDPLDCARRELEEETGYVAGKWTHLATLFMIPGTSSHRMAFYLAEDLRPGSQALEEGECLEVRTVPLADLLRGMRDHVASSIVVDAKTHLGLLHAAWLRGLLDRGE